MPLCLQSFIRMAQCDASEDGRRQKVKISGHEQKNGQTKVSECECECVCVCVQRKCPGTIQCHVSVYLFQLSARSLRDTHSCKVAAG